jgi:CheY-like chemotaxis protein
MAIAVLIDDDDDDLSLLKDSIKEMTEPIECLTFSDPIEAMSFLGTSTVPDFIFLDINMPMMNGIECLQLLRAQRKFDATLITVLSTSMPDDVVESLTQQRADFTFAKPHIFAEYDRILKEVFAKDQKTFVESRCLTPVYLKRKPFQSSFQQSA